LDLLDVFHETREVLELGPLVVSHVHGDVDVDRALDLGWVEVLTIFHFLCPFDRGRTALLMRTSGIPLLGEPGHTSSSETASYVPMRMRMPGRPPTRRCSQTAVSATS